jgi:hypothetical protein
MADGPFLKVNGGSRIACAINRTAINVLELFLRPFKAIAQQLLCSESRLARFRPNRTPARRGLLPALTALCR